MNWFASVNLIQLFDFYLAAMFVVGTYRRIAQYRAFAGLRWGCRAAGRIYSSSFGNFAPFF